MAKEIYQFVCPCCGMHAPLERLEESELFEFALKLKTLGGKVAMTEEEKEEFYRHAGGRGRAPGSMTYDDVEDPEKLAAAATLLQARIRELVERYL